jgi:hypothetical protein
VKIPALERSRADRTIAPVSTTPWRRTACSSRPSRGVSPRTQAPVAAIAAPRPDAPRPYKTPLYPVIPLVFIIAGLGIVLNTFVDDPGNALKGSAIIAVGVPVYFLWRRSPPAPR